ncbi:MAG: T9SS type A sorting domain-containing protein [Salibacteraceae bacterium]
MPEVVMADEEGYLAVNYDAVVPLLVEGMKEQQDQLVAQKVTIEEQNADLENAQQVNAEQQVRLETAEIKNEELTNQVDELESVVEQQDAAIRQLQEEMMAMKNSLQASGATKTTSASDEQVQLFQNRPNPFRESTEIHFYLPSTVEQATLVVFNLEGKEIARFGNLDRGYGNVVLEAGALQPGNYVYRLIADNEVVDSKTLVLSK